MKQKTLVNHLKDIFIAAAIALLIWLYAEAENVTTNTIEFNIQLTSPSGEQIYLSDPSLHTITMDYKSSTGQVSVIDRTLKDKTIKLTVSPNPDRTTQLINIRKKLEESPEFKNLALNIEKLLIDHQSKETITADIQAMKKINLNIKLAVADEAHVVNDSLAFTTKTAQVILPRSLAAQLKDKPLRATITPSHLSSAKPDQNHTINIDLKLPKDFRYSTFSPDDITITPKQIQVNLRVDAQKLTGEKLEVLSLQPPTLQNDYLIEKHIDYRRIKDIIFTGSRQAIDAVRGNKKQQLYAQITLNKEIVDRLIKQAITDEKSGKFGYSKINATIIAPSNIRPSPLNIDIYIKVTPRKR